MTQSDRDYIPVGKIHRSHGLRGELKVSLFHSDSDLFHTYRQIFVGNKPETIHSLEIESVRRSKNYWLVKFIGIDDRTQADELKTQQLFLPYLELKKKLHKNEYLVFDLIGMSVYTSQGNELGIVQEVGGDESHSILVVRDETKAKEYFVPMWNNNILSVELDARRITVREAPEVI